MPRDLNKEAFLWHVMTSPEFMDRAFAKLTEAAEFLRQRIKEHASINRYPPVPRWLQAMEELEGTYANARAMVAQGQLSAIDKWASRLMDIPRGFSESSMDWLPRDQEDHFKKTLDQAYGIASNYMRATTMSGLHLDDPDGDWRVDKDYGYRGSTIGLYWEDFADVRGIPEYAADASLAVATGELVPWTGVWIPSQGAGSAALAYAQQGQIMQPAYEVFFDDADPDFEQTRPVDVTWHPFRPTGRMLPVNGEASPSEPLRLAAGEPATHPGWWFTPAKQDSRRYFRQGDVFPDIEGSSYGATFWQWSPDQSDPKL